MSGTYFITHYCTNTGSVSSTMSGANIGGIAGEIGNPQKWTLKDKFKIVSSVVTLGFGYLNATAAIKLLTAPTRTSDYNRFIVDYDLTLATQGNLNDENLSELMLPVKPFMSSTEYDAYINSMSTMNDIAISTVRTDLQNIRAQHEIYTGFNQYNQDVITYSTDESTKEQFFQNMNNMLNERADEVSGMEQQDQLIHSAVGSACMIVSGVCFISSLALSGGTPLIIVKILATVNAPISIANNLTKSCTNFEENTVVISQCINTGNLQCGTGSNVGGFVGQLNEYSVISECLNTGAITDTNGRNAAQLTPDIMNESIVEDCVLVGGKSWNYIDVVNMSSSAEVSGIYYWTDGYNPSNTYEYLIPIVLSDDLAKVDTYKELSIGDRGNHWTMSQYGNLTLPVPYKSRFTE